MKRSPPRLLIWITVALMAASAVTIVVAKGYAAPRVSISYAEHPTIGNPKARVHLVVFEEPKCTNCARFTEELFPEIKKRFIDTNKATYTVIPVSFLSGSMPAATALLCAYNADPLYPNGDLFFAYLDYLYKHQPSESEDWATVDRLIAMAKETSPALNPNQLRKCIDTQLYRIRIQKNTELGEKIMQGALATPTLFVDGVMVEPLTLQRVNELIGGRL